MEIACKLTDIAFTERKMLLRKELFSAVENVVELENGFLLNLKESEGFDRQLMELIAAERKCCVFFDIRVHFKSNHGGISLELSGGEGVKAFLQQEFQLLLFNPALRLPL